MTTEPTTNRVPLTRLKERLGLIWGVAFVAAFITMLVLNGRLGDAVGKGWGWFSQTFIPTSGVIVSGIIAAQRREDARTVSLFFFRFSWIALSFYAAIAIASPFTGPANVPLLSWLETSSTWLGITQGLVAGLIAFTFVDGTKDS